jgi:hypothetical protein
VKHYYSGNGVFAVEVFTDPCKEKDMQRNFSDIGIQRQDTEADRSIQAGLYMTRVFIIH